MSATPIWDACTPHQRNVLGVLARTGGSNREVGKRLGLTEQQVKSVLRRITYKLKIGNKRSILVVAYLNELGGQS